MKKILSFLLCLTLGLSLVFVGGDKPVQAKRQDAKIGALQVKKTNLCDKNGNKVMLRGVSTQGIAWFPKYINAKCFQELHDKWGVNVVRLAMYTEEYAGYCSGGNKKELKNKIIKGVQLAKKYNMYAIVDWHILSDQNPQKHKKEAKEFFKEISATFGSYDNVLYEICNEPNGATTWNTIKSYAEEVIPVIRKNDSDAIIIVGTPNWSQEVDKAAQNPIKKYDNVMYALHFYAGTHKQWLRDRMVSAIKKGLPVFVTEFGTCDASGNGKMNKKEANAWISTLEKYKVSYVNWNLSNKEETSSIISSKCTKSSGFTRSNLSSSGKWLYDLLRKKAGIK